MTNEIFVMLLAALYSILLWWGVRHLPSERWQIAASIPALRRRPGVWRGTNLTFYGLFIASALTLSAALMLLMLGSLGIRPVESLVFLVPLLLVCLPASRLVARWVEHKPATSTIAGASFVGLIVAPWLVMLLRAVLGPALAPGFQVMPVLAAVAVCYTMGEGVGRLACISFGCCYGKPLAQCPSWSRVVLGRLGLVFDGPFKKISYASHLDGQAVAPVQAITSALNGAASLVGLYFFLQGWYAGCLWATLSLSLLWRVFSEFLRADFRGGRSFTAYQWMALVSVIYVSVLPKALPAGNLPLPALANGIAVLWSPGVLIALQVIWLAVFVFTGLSRVTNSTIEFHVLKSRI